MSQQIEPIPTPSGREHVTPPKSLAELRLRPNFTAPLKVTPDTKLIDFLTTYSWERLEPCGLSTCKKKHYHGYLVITQNGTETNIGHNCGEKAFGIDFKEARARYVRDEDRRRTLTRMLELQSLAPQVKQQIHDLSNRKHGVRWVHSLREAVRGVVGRQGYDHLKWRAMRGDYAVVETREIPKGENGAPMGRSGRQQFHYKSVTLGQVAPMDWLQWSFSSELFTGVKDKFMLLAGIDPVQMQTKELKAKLKDLDGWEQRIRASEEMLTQAIRFLAQENLKMVDIDLKVHRRNAGSLSDWTRTEEYKSLVRGIHRDGQTVG